MPQLTPEEIDYIIIFQPTRAMMLGLLPWPETCLGCGFTEQNCVCC